MFGILTAREKEKGGLREVGGERGEGIE